MKFIGILLFILLLLTGCNGAQNNDAINEVNEPDGNSSEEVINQPNQEEPIPEENNVEEYSLIDETFLSNLGNGKIKYCEQALDPNITASEILSNFGEPEWEDYWDGGYGRQYGDCLYFVDSDNPDAKMTAIDYSSEKFTHTPSEIIEVLGEPESKGISEMDGSYFLFYRSGDYSAFFEFENENSPVGHLRVKYEN